MGNVFPGVEKERTIEERAMTVQEIEETIMQLPLEELIKLATWFDEYSAEVWEKQIEEDLDSGRLDTILKEVNAEYDAGLAQPL
jgi:hypothetical protein